MNGVHEVAGSIPVTLTIYRDVSIGEHKVAGSSPVVPTIGNDTLQQRVTSLLDDETSVRFRASRLDRDVAQWQSAKNFSRRLLVSEPFNGECSSVGRAPDWNNSLI